MRPPSPAFRRIALRWAAIRWPSAKASTLAVLAAGYLATLAANLPGQLSYDSIVQLADGRSGRYHTWHPPIMAWLLGLGDRLLPGTALYVAGVAALIFGGLALLVASRPKVGWAAPFVALVICGSPLMVNEQGIVWKDVLFADAAVAGFLLLSIAVRPDRDRQDRALAVTGALLVFGLCALVRQNGVIVSAFGCATLGWLVWRRRLRQPLKVRLPASAGVGVAALAAILLCAFTVNAALNRRAADDAGTAGQLRMLQIYDLTGIAARAPTLDLSALRTPGLAERIRGVTGRYTAERVDTISTTPGIDQAIAKGAPGLDAAWRGALLHHPGEWVTHRLTVMRWMLWPPDVDRCDPVYTGVDGPKPLMDQLNLQSHWRAQDIRLAYWGELFLPTPLYIHLWWALAAAGLIGWLAVSKAAQDKVLLAMLAAMLAFTASFLVIGIACDHRYLYALDLAVMATLLHLAAGRSAKPRTPRTR